jgi:hypothetical protein
MERAMRLLGALFFGILTGIAISYAGSSLDWGFAVNAAAPSAQGVQWVDRAHKGDRLDRTGTKVGKQPVPPAKLLIGCEPVASPLSSPVQARIPGRCAA